MINDEIRSRLFELQDVKYRDFQKKLIPTVNAETVIGVRLPELRKLAKELSRRGDHTEFLSALPHFYYDENQLHALIINEIKDFSACIKEVERFLPYIDNWAVCDSLLPKCFKKHKTELKELIYKWLDSGKTYSVRFGTGMLMRLFLDGDFKPEYAERVAKIRSEEYYVNMMTAWYFATALAKQYEAVISFIENKQLDTRTHNKAIQKASESYRVPPERKVYLKTLKRTSKIK